MRLVKLALKLADTLKYVRRSALRAGGGVVELLSEAIEDLTA